MYATFVILSISGYLDNTGIEVNDDSITLNKKINFYPKEDM